MSGFTSTFIPISAQAATCTNICVVKKPARKRYGVYDRRGGIPNQVLIDDRPVIVDRKSMYIVIRSVLNKTAEAVRTAVVDGLTPSSTGSIPFITYADGRAFVDHSGMASDLDARIYFAHPYSSWERGLNENTNGLIRQCFPRSMLIVCYEATYIGFTLQWDLADKGYVCEVVAPTSIPSPRGKQIKTDRIDAVQLVQFYANGLLTLVSCTGNGAEERS